MRKFGLRRDGVRERRGRAAGAAAGAWHVDEASAARYATGTAREPDAWSLERHVETCGACAARVSAAVQGSAAGTALSGVRSELLAAIAPRAESVPVPGPVPVPVPGPALAPLPLPLTVPVPVPLLPPVTGPGRFARVLWAAGPALRGPWLVALVLVAAGAVGLAYATGSAGVRPLLLALAPLLPPAGVAVSYGRHTDPMYEITASTPGGGARLLLTRTAAVLAVSLPLLTLAGAMAGAVLPAGAPGLPGAPGPAAWLLPGLALTLAALALGSYVGCRTGAAVVGAAWALPLAAPLLRLRPASAAVPAAEALAALSEQVALVLSGAVAQGLWGAGAAVCAAVLVTRRRAFDRPSSLAFPSGGLG
ncbi:zf-HC2 domain-containing protein [Streptomyces sp. NPDC093085]|uniref:zf-HC2 domain-containing protein n=1 Tax=Streptomyces sp. NPDC093085 TaxID=3155068 RepID=UPI003442D0B3